MISLIPGYRIIKLNHEQLSKYTEVLCHELPGGTLQGKRGILFPGHHCFQVKNILPVEEGVVSIAIKGVSRSLLVSGALLLDKDWPFLEKREAILFHNEQSFPDGQMLFRWPDFPGFESKGYIVEREVFVIAKWEIPSPLMPGMQMVGMGSDKREYFFTVFHPGLLEKSLLQRCIRDLQKGIKTYSDPVELYVYLLELKGCVHFPPSLIAGMDFCGVKQFGNWVVKDAMVGDVERLLRKKANQPGGLMLSELQNDIPVDLLMSIAENMCNRGELFRRGDCFFPPGEPPLSPFHRTWLTRIHKAGEYGFQKLYADHVAIRVLERSGFIFGGDKFWFSAEAIKQLSDRLLAHLHCGDSFLIADASKRLKGNRAVILDVLKILERQNILMLQSDGVTRVVR